MQDLPKYAGALRCIGQALQHRGIEVFELRNHAQEFHVQGGDPNPPYTGLINVKFSPEDLKMLDREGQARRGPRNREVRFDGLAEMLRAVGEYVDIKRGELRRLNNSGSSTSGPASVEIEYETRGGDIELEKLSMSFIREACVRMYKRRSQSREPLSIFARRS
jgi:hypothetical protein